MHLHKFYYNSILFAQLLHIPRIKNSSQSQYTAQYLNIQELGAVRQHKMISKCSIPRCHMLGSQGQEEKHRERSSGPPTKEEGGIYITY